MIETLCFFCETHHSPKRRLALFHLSLVLLPPIPPLPTPNLQLKLNANRNPARQKKRRCSKWNDVETNQHSKREEAQRHGSIVPGRKDGVRATSVLADLRANLLFFAAYSLSQHLLTPNLFPCATTIPAITVNTFAFAQHHFSSSCMPSPSLFVFVLCCPNGSHPPSES